MKKILLPILFFALIFSSCSLFFQDEYGTVTIDLEGGNARSINSSTGLPNIADSELEIEIAMGGTRSLYKKILASEPKFFQANFPIGARLEINIKLNGPSASWSANAKYTVKEGNNDIQLLLNKNASYLANVGFSKIPTPPTSTTSKYEFNIAGRTIEISSSKEPVFTRDSRGRLYIAYTVYDTSGVPSTWKLNRYESDGTLNNFASSSDILTKIASVSSVKLASDPVKGTVYAASNSKLYLIKDDGSTIETQSGGAAIPEGLIAVYNNNLFVLDDNNLKMFTITEGGRGLTLIPVGSPISVSKQQIKINSSPPISNPITVNFINILIKNNSIYILFEAKTIPGTSSVSPYYSLGGMLEYNYDSNGLKDNPKDYGFDKEITYNLNDLVITTSQDNFYGAVSFIGYDEQNIYIADDGCTLKKESNNVKIDKNVNRIFSFNTSTKALSYSATENKWFEEHEEAVSPIPPGPPPSPITGKILLWEKNTDSGAEGFKFYFVDENNSSTAFLQDGGNDYPTDVFCYDQEGNLYVVWFRSPNYCVRRYEKKSDGSYNTQNVKEQTLKGSGTTPLDSSKPPIAIAVDISDNTNGYLYYGYKDGTNTPMRISRWNKPNFEAVIENKNVQIDNKFKITAMAANKDGAFVAVKQNYTTPLAGYKINILKYKNDSSSHGDWYFYNSAQNHSSGDNYKDENIFAMKVVNGILFFLITRQKGQMNNSSTNTVKIEAELWKTKMPLNNTFNNQRYQDLWKSKDKDIQHGYAPYRFISTVPNKLIIASDGYYVKKTPNQIENKNKVLSFDITTSTTWTVTPKDTSAKFSRELSYDGNKFIWE